MPRLNLLRHHRRSASNQGNTSAVPPQSSKPPSTPPPRTAPPTVPPLDALPLINSGSPGLGSPGQWLVEGSSAPTTATSHVVGAPQPPRPPVPGPRLHSAKSSKPTASAAAPSTKSTLSQQVKAANAALAAKPPTATTSSSSSLTAPAGGSNSYNLSSNSSNSNAAITKDSSTGSTSYRRNAKLTLLNPMSLLMRRRSSQAHGLLSDNVKSRSARDLPDDFDPGIIYGTRHPDWSNPPKRGQNEVVRPPVNGRTISPLPPVSPLVDPNNKLLKVEVVADDDGGSSRIDERLVELEKQRTPVFIDHFGSDERPADSVGIPSGDADVTPAPGAPRVPTTDPPPAAMHDPDKPRVMEGGILSSTALTISRASSIASSNEGELDDGKPRGVTLVDHPLSLPHHLMTNSSRFSFEASSAAESNGGEDPDYEGPDDDELGLELDFEGDDDEGFSRANEGLFMMPNEGMYVEDDYTENDGGVLLPLRIDPKHEIGIALSKDSPIDVNTPTVPGPSLTGMFTALPTIDPEPEQTEQQSLAKRLGNPRGLDLSDDSDFDELEQGNGMAGYEDDDDDLYFDDGIILDDLNFHSTTGDEDSANKEQRDSFPSTLGVSSGGAMQVEDGSLDSGADIGSNEGTAGGGSGVGNGSFPPFLNPIGGGLGCTQQHAQFYAPDGTMLDGDTGLPLALSTLTQQLYQYQKQQQREAAAAEAGYESDYPDYGSQSGYYSIDDDDGSEDADAMVAEANAEALAYDTEFYGQEFGFYPVSSASSLDENVFAGGYFGCPTDPARPIIRRPSLTPISERSEGSYRNSFVFPLVPIPPPLESADADITLEHLLRLRRNAWGGSASSLKSSRGGGGSPVNGSHSPLTSPPGVSAPPGLSHPGKNAMLPTKASFEEAGLELQGVVASSSGGWSTADSSYASAVGSQDGVGEAMGWMQGRG